MRPYDRLTLILALQGLNTVLSAAVLYIFWIGGWW